MGPDDLTTQDLKGAADTESAGSIDELYGFGLMLLNECMDRTKQLDTKAGCAYWLRRSHHRDSGVSAFSSRVSYAAGG